MKSTVRKPAAFAAGFLVTIFISFAAPAQTLSDDTVNRADWITSAVAQRAALAPFGPRPRGCFCDEDCFAALLKKEKKQRALFPARFTFPLRTDGEIRAIDFEGLKKFLQRDPSDPRPLLINFWATWCDPCREEFPDLVKIDGDYRAKGLNFVAVSLDDISDIKTVVPKFLREMKAEMPVVLLNVNDPEPVIKAVDATWDGQLPATFLYDKEGKVVFKHFGKINAAELRAAIDKIVGNKQ